MIDNFKNKFKFKLRFFFRLLLIANMHPDYSWTVKSGQMIMVRSDEPYIFRRIPKIWHDSMDFMGRFLKAIWNGEMVNGLIIYLIGGRFSYKQRLHYYFSIGTPFRRIVCWNAAILWLNAKWNHWNTIRTDKCVHVSNEAFNLFKSTFNYAQNI